MNNSCIVDNIEAAAKVCELVELCFDDCRRNAHSLSGGLEAGAAEDQLVGLGCMLSNPQAEVAPKTRAAELTLDLRATIIQ